MLIGDRLYRTKADALQTVQAVRDRVRDTGIVSDSDDDFLRDLVSLHPRADEKIGVGIRCFEVRRNLGNTDGFWLIRTDGSETDFSFMGCLNGSTHEDRVRSAMRYAVIFQMQAARETAFRETAVLSCPVTGESITAKTCHIDHDSPTFVELADAFAAQTGGYEKIRVCSEDGAIGCRFSDCEIEKQWQSFHGNNARLRPVSKAANLGILRRGSRAK